MGKFLLFVLVLIGNAFCYVRGYKRGLDDAMEAIDETFKEIKDEYEKNGNHQQD